MYISAIVKCHDITMAGNKADILDYPSDPITPMINNDLTMEAILTRDQRTTSHRVIDRCAKVSSAVRERTAGSSSSTSSSSSYVRNSSSRRMRGYARHPRLTVKWLRLGSLLVTLLVASIHGAPTMTTDRRIRQGKWVNPCGLSLTDGDPEGDLVQLNDSQLLSQIVIQAKTALLHAQLFRDDYVNKTFRSNIEKVHNDWKSNRYDWLPNKQDIPKELNETLAEEYLEKLELDKALVDAYEFMQAYAVGLEQIVWDQKDNLAEFQKQFSDTEYKLRTVLCELQTALVERGVKPRPDVTRDIMAPEIRQNMAEGRTSLRDWIIFRDYMNGLQYIIEVFQHLGKRLRS